jgi:8-oxo-dGTP diphosphatase
MAKPLLNVAIAILSHKNQILVGWRNAEQHQGNKAEFPGGKVEEGEMPQQACRREILEEVGIDVEQWFSFDVIHHEYDDLIVKLHVFHAHIGLEQANAIQAPWKWVQRQDLATYPFPKANKVLVQRLALPKLIKISTELSALNQLDEQSYLYWRTEPSLDAIKLINDYSVEQLTRLIVNLDVWQQLNSIQQQAIAMVHLKHQQLLQMSSQQLISGQSYLAACHDQASLLHAAQLGVDAMLLSPVNHTLSHERQEPLGWEGFKALAAQVQIPVYALGGIALEDLEKAQVHAAYGIAGIRTFQG